MSEDGARFDALLASYPASLSVREVAEAVGVSTHVVRGLLTDGELRGMKIRHEWRVLRADLIAYLQRVSNDVEESVTDDQ